MNTCTNLYFQWWIGRNEYRSCLMVIRSLLFFSRRRICVFCGGKRCADVQLKVWTLYGNRVPSQSVEVLRPDCLSKSANWIRSWNVYTYILAPIEEHWFIQFLLQLEMFASLRSWETILPRVLSPIKRLPVESTSHEKKHCLQIVSFSRSLSVLSKRVSIRCATNRMHTKTANNSCSHIRSYFSITWGLCI